MGERPRGGKRLENNSVGFTAISDKKAQEIANQAIVGYQKGAPSDVKYSILRLVREVPIATSKEG